MFRTLDSLTLTREARSSAWSSSVGLACEASHRVSCGLLGPHTTTTALHTHSPADSVPGELCAKDHNTTQGLWEASDSPTNETGAPFSFALCAAWELPPVHTGPSFLRSLHREERCSGQRHGKAQSHFCISNTRNRRVVFPSQAVPLLFPPLWHFMGEHCMCSGTLRMETNGQTVPFSDNPHALSPQKHARPF